MTLPPRAKSPAPERGIFPKQTREKNYLTLAQLAKHPPEAGTDYQVDCSSHCANSARKQKKSGTCSVPLSTIKTSKCRILYQTAIYPDNLLPDRSSPAALRKCACGTFSAQAAAAVPRGYRGRSSAGSSGRSGNRALRKRRAAPVRCRSPR